MVEINLLPWRKHRRIYEDKIEKKVILLSIVITFLILSGAHFFVWGQVSDMQTHIEQLEEEAHKFSHEQKFMQDIDHHSIPVDLVKNIFAYRSETKNLFTELGKAHEYSVCFNEIGREKNRITFSGNTRSASDLTEFLKNWSAGSLFTEIKIEHLQQRPGHGLMEFRLEAIEK